MFLSCLLFCDDHLIGGSRWGNIEGRPDGGSGAVYMAYCMWLLGAVLRPWCLCNSVL